MKTLFAKCSTLSRKFVSGSFRDMVCGNRYFGVSGGCQNSGVCFFLEKPAKNAEFWLFPEIFGYFFLHNSISTDSVIRANLDAKYGLK